MRPDSRLLRLAQSSRFWLLLTIGLGFLSGLLTIGQARSVSAIVSRVFLEGAGTRDVQGLLVLTAGLFTLRAVLSWMSSLSAKTIAVEVKNRVRKYLLDHIQRLGPAYLQKERSGEISSTVVEGVEALDAYFSQYLPQLVLSALIPLSILVVAFPMDLLSGFVLLITFPLIPFFMFLIGRTSKNITDRQYKTLSHLSAQFLDSLQGLTTLKLFNRAQAQSKVIAEASDQYRKTTMKVLQVTFLSALALELLATISTAVVAVQIGLRLLYYRIGFEQAFFLLIIAPEFYIPMRMLGLRYHAGMEGQSAADRIFDILDTQPILEGEEQPNETHPDREDFQSLELDQITFTYPGETSPAVQEISLQVRAGDHLALVGESGAGKTTLASLLLGFFPPDRGQIKINGELLRPEQLKGWRSQVAWVPQQPALIAGSIADNIRLARPDADQAAVAGAARAAHLDEFIRSLPEGYQTQIGEGGARLSGGQAQRLALARAFLKDAPLLLLDEPTSQLDPITESLLAESTRKLMIGRTVITIAHRLNTIFRADQILVLDGGSILERGSHPELIQKQGRYQELVRAYTGGESVPPPPREPLPEISLEEAPHTGLDTLPALESIPAPQPTWLRLLGFLKPYWQPILFSVLLGFLTVGSSVGLMGSSAWLISAAALHPSIAELEIAIVGVRFFGILRGVARYVERLTSHNVTFQVLTSLRTWFYEALSPLAPARLMAYRAGDLLSRIISDIKTLEDFYIRSIAPPLVAVLIGTVTAVFTAGYHPRGGIILGGFFLLMGLVQPLAVRRAAFRPGKKLVRERSRLGEELVNFIQGLPDWLVFGRADDLREDIRTAGESYLQTQLTLARVTGLNEGLFTLFSNLAMWLVLLTSIPLVRSGDLSGLMLATLSLMTLAAFEAVQPLPQAVETLASSLEAGDRLFEIVDARPALQDPVDPLPLPPEPVVQVEQLSFTYPGSSRPAIKSVSFRLNKGETLALVGPSGSGKSTLIHLLLRFWDYQQGEILLGSKGVPLKQLQQREIRRQISLVPQQTYLFSDTIRSNLALAKPTAGDQEITQAAQQARIHDLIQSLPEGYQTQVGERGQRFSGGEQQRMAVARAVLKDAPLMIFDEPTANLDPITERQLLETLFEIMENKTSLLVTHRLVGLSRADRILVLHQGEIIERGTERELVNNQGFYYRMWSLQNQILKYS